ncbi:MAG: hypothetical protein ABR585_01365 [Gemmatimonadaceae bacterium]
MWPLLLSVQLLELLWILFTYLGIEHVRTDRLGLHLDFLPYSHSVFTAAFLGAIVWGMGKAAQRRYVGTALAFGIISHLLLDVVHHEPDIALLPLAWGPRFGLGLMNYPIADFIVELAFCAACWKYFGGSRQLLVGIMLFNLLNVPLMFASPSAASAIAANQFLLPTIILAQLLASWLLVWWLSRGTILSDEQNKPVAIVG